MKNRPIATISFVLFSVLVTFVAPIFDSSLYGVNGHPSEWLSFMPSMPFRHMGLSLILSPFLHLNFQHLVTNTILFIPVAMMVERKNSGRNLALNFFLIHFQVLFFLIFVTLFYPLEGKAFLGSSHVIIGLYSFWSITNKKYNLLYFSILILAVGLWQDQSHLTTLVHVLGLLTGLELSVFCRLRSKLRSKSTN